MVITSTRFRPSGRVLRREARLTVARGQGPLVPDHGQRHRLKVPSERNVLVSWYTIIYSRVAVALPSCYHGAKYKHIYVYVAYEVPTL